MPPVEVEVDPPTVEPGRVRAGLETWIADYRDPPGALVAAARVLADQVDEDPSASPMWGRLQTALDALVDHVREIRRETMAEMSVVLDEVSHAGDVEGYRVRKYREAEATGEDPSRWSKLIPAACAQGDHRPHRWPAGTTTCLDCDAHL